MALKICCVLFVFLIGIACIHGLVLPKLDRLTLEKQSEPDNGSIKTEIQEDELAIARKILERVPLIDGFVMSLFFSFKICYFKFQFQAQ